MITDQENLVYGQIYNDTRSMIFVLSGLSNTPTNTSSIRRRKR